jgi:hypothetical protein
VGKSTPSIRPEAPQVISRRLAGSPVERAEFQHYARRHVACACRSRLIVDEQFLSFDADRGGERFRVQGVCDDRLRGPDHPIQQAITNVCRPPLLLALRSRQCLDVVAHEIRRDGADVVGQIDIFGKPPDDLIGLRQRCAALEHQMFAERRSLESGERPHHPHILLERMSWSPRAIRRDGQRFATIGNRKAEKGVSHLLQSQRTAPAKSEAAAPLQPVR